jgi:hypothetical protein
MLGHSQLPLLPDGRGGEAQLVQGAEDPRGHYDPTLSARSRHERGVHQRETTPLAGEAGNNLCLAPRLREGPLQDIRGVQPLLMLLREEQLVFCPLNN